VLDRLVEGGNTVVVIEHNLDVIKTADWVIDMGPEGGDAGGRIVAEGTPEQVAAVSASYTGRFLSKLVRPPRPAAPRASGFTIHGGLRAPAHDAAPSPSARARDPGHVCRLEPLSGTLIATWMADGWRLARFRSSGAEVSVSPPGFGHGERRRTGRRGEEGRMNAKLTPITPMAVFALLSCASLAQAQIPIRVTDVRAVEGSTGFHPVIVPVNVSGPPPVTITVDWTLVAGTATAPADFTMAKRNAHLPALSSAPQNISVQVNGDTLDEWSPTRCRTPSSSSS
jgi:hypothetical protein